MDGTYTKLATDARSPMPYMSLRIRRWSIAVLALLAFSCVLMPILVFAMRPPPIRSHEDQIARLLQQHGITPSAINLGERWPDRINIQYGTNVYPYGYRFKITRANGIQEDGWLECAQREAKCSITMLSLGISKTPLPEFTHDEPLPIPGWLQPYLSQIQP